MNFFITGSAGFIGYHVAKNLLESGHNIVGFDNFNDYYSPDLKERRNGKLLSYKNFVKVRGDLIDYPLIENILKKHNIERVCHLAAQAGVRNSIKNPFQYQQSNLEGHLNILEACRHCGISRLVYASSSSVYGGNKKVPFNENDSVDQPVSLYAATKKSNELMSYTYTHLYNLQTIGLRFFTVYGPWGRPDMAYWLFTQAMLSGKPIKVFNNGDMKRDFTYINDIVLGCTQALMAEDLSMYEIFNLGNNKPESLMDFINILSKNLNITPKIEFLPMQDGDVAITHADITSAESKLKYKPSTSLGDGLKAFTDWFKTEEKCDI